MTVSVVIVTWNSATTIEAMLDSVALQTGADLEVIVVDNDSHDETLDIVDAHPVGATVIRNPTNLGLAAANNQGLTAGTGEYFLICNPDIVLEPGCLAALLESAQRHPRAGFVIAKLRHPDGTLQPGVGDLPKLSEVLLGRGAALRRASTEGIWWDGWPHDEERTIGHGQEACYLVRRATVDEVGGQDPRFRLDWEGLDWSARVGAGGWEIWFCPDAAAVHAGGVSVRQAQLRWILWSHRGMFLYFADRSNPLLRPAFAVLFALRAAAKASFYLLRRNAYRTLRVRRDSPS